ncbi:MAG: phosphoribosylamine--glycine ligase [Actinomycetes bacterium]
MRVLVVGSGGREHALVRSLLADPSVTEVLAAPGNAGIADEVPVFGVDLSDADALAALAVELGADFVLVGPELPLSVGAADAVRAAGIPCFGPSREAAAIEGSKAFAKDIMASAGVPTALAHICSDLARVEHALDEFGPPYVVKADGLAAGKGVVVTNDRMVAIEHARSALIDAAVLVEEYLDGPEISLFAVTDGIDLVVLAPAQDFKRVGAQDTGPNTGGMGAYSPLPWAPPDLIEVARERVLEPVIAEMAHRGTPFAGLLYAGLALTSRGMRVIEFNARFGDPETQAVLARLESPLGELLYAAATGQLAQAEPLRWSKSAAVTVVMAAPGYPVAPALGAAITGTEAAKALPDIAVLHAGTARSGADEQLVVAGGRVLSVTATGTDLGQARDRAYAGVELIDFAGAVVRPDIAERAAAGLISGP